MAERLFDKEEIEKAMQDIENDVIENRHHAWKKGKLKHRSDDRTLE